MSDIMRPRVANHTDNRRNSLRPDKGRRSRSSGQGSDGMRIRVRHHPDKGRTSCGQPKEFHADKGPDAMRTGVRYHTNKNQTPHGQGSHIHPADSRRNSMRIRCRLSCGQGVGCQVDTTGVRCLTNKDPTPCGHPEEFRADKQGPDITRTGIRWQAIARVSVWCRELREWFRKRRHHMHGQGTPPEARPAS